MAQAPSHLVISFPTTVVAMMTTHCQSRRAAVAPMAADWL
jgi:hypothetical protein